MTDQVETSVVPIDDTKDLISDIDSNFITSKLPKGHTLIRKYLVYSALNFINNPKLQITSNNDKKNFLLKKGLTQDEIDLAFELCITRPANENDLKRELDLLSSINGDFSIIKNNTVLGRILHLLYLFTIWGGFVYGAYSFYQTKLRPYFDKSYKKEKPEEVIHQHILELNEQFADLCKNVFIVREFVKTYCQNQNDYIMQLKNELSTIKSLLVNKNQFPSVPTIPKWQKLNNKKPLATDCENNQAESNSE